MEVRKQNGLNIFIDKKYELILAIYAVYLKNNPSMREQLDWIEVPPVAYMDELETIINSKEHNEILDILIGFEDCGTPINIAVGLDDNYNVDDKKLNRELIDRWFSYEELQRLSYLLKKYADSIGWDEFFYKHKIFYISLVDRFSSFPENLDLTDINSFYKIVPNSYRYMPSILMNGGFSASDVQGNYYYIRGFEFDLESKDFYYDVSYLSECLFHEFSHPNINPLVDKYYKLFTNIDLIYKDAIMHGLSKIYSANKRSVLYEYFVRANAFVLNQRYYPDIKVEDDEWILTHGFRFLPQLVEFITLNMSNYSSYEEFFKAELIDYMNNILKKDLIKKEF